MLLAIIRAVFILVVAGLGVRLAKANADSLHWAFLFGGVIAAAVAVLCLDIFTPRKRIQTISAIYFGLIVGLFLGYLVQIAIEPTLTQFLPEPVNAQRGLTLVSSRS